MPSPFDDCSHAELALLVREFLMAGHLIDRAGMPHVMAACGQEVFAPVAIEEWMGASPIYTKRMQRALRFEGDSVETIFKGMQFDIGAPPQFLDFRFKIDDHDHGEFWLDHCGALDDVEPMGEVFVHTMCHDIEDPTFDATATATNARAQVRPIHRPPRVPADRHPVCHWTVVISDEHPALPVPRETEQLATARAASIELSEIDMGEPGSGDYSGPLLADLRFQDWSRSALVRIAEEICLQGHLLALSFVAALTRRLDRERAIELMRRQLTGVAGLVAERLCAALALEPTPAGVVRLLSLHPALLPAQYVEREVSVENDRVTLRIDGASAAVADGGWAACLDAAHPEPLDAIVQALDRRFRCEPIGHEDAVMFEIVIESVAAPRPGDVELAAISTGARFAFVDRGTPVVVRSR